MTTICISSGHGKYVRGASGYIDEVDEARKVVERVAEFLRAVGVTVYTFHDNTSTSQNQNLNTIVNWHNSKTRDWDHSCHFNAYSTTSKPMGTEVWYYSQSSAASKLSTAMADAGSFINRGGKQSSSLFFLSNTEMPALLWEVCFVDSQADTDLYHQHFDSICEAIAESISGREVPDAPPEPEEPIPPEPGEEARVTIDIVATGNVVVVINGQEFRVSGTEAMPEEEEIEPNHMDIETTVFGGSGDPNYSAYGPYDAQGRGPYLDDSELYVALPWRWTGDRPKVRVFNRETGLNAIGDIMDVGPWNTDDEEYVHGDERPSAETHYAMHEALPTGPNAGKVPTNGAGLDLSPALARAVGISGKGRCDWAFVDADAVA
jgi:N-acetylmuramoyl-L-alanine amidase